MESVNVLALNCGSSSLKFGLYAADGGGIKLIDEGEAEEITDPVGALPLVFDALKRCGRIEPSAIGHRFVHGGPRIREHQRVTPRILDQLREAVDYAPLHLPAALAVLEAMQQKMPKVGQVVCLDTTFHRNMPDVSKTFALPADIRARGVERYGFHGLSLESLIEQLDPVPERLVAAHLGNGSSITAIRNGASIDTTMGLTPTGGVMMGTRCGDLDPGVMTYLARQEYRTPEQLETLFDRRSGLLGVSGKSSDVRELLAAREQDRLIDLALRMFCYQVRKAIAAMAAALGGLDALAFTGGIGEHAAELRSEICSGLEFLGNFRILVLPSREDLQIARITARLTPLNG